MKGMNECSEVVLAGETKTLIDKVSEAKAKMYIKAEDNLRVVDIDHGLMEEEKTKKKCDYMVLGINSGKTHMVELKGSNIDEAFEQISGTIDYLYAHQESKDYVVSRKILDAYVVSPRRQKIPNISSPEEKELVKKLARGNIKKPKNMFDLLHFVKVVKGQKKVMKSGRQYIISGRAPLELG